MRTADFFRLLLKYRSIEKLLEKHPDVSEDEILSHFNRVLETLTKNEEPPFELYCDGASSGNPGNSGIGFVIKRNGKTLLTHEQYIGKTTNNVAEYTALLEGLKKLKELGANRVRIFSDSELLTKQLNGLYAVKSPHLKKLYNEAKKLLESFADFSVMHIPREQNREADRLARSASQQKVK